MPKNPSLLQVIPNQKLVFTGPFTRITKADLQLRNISSSSVCFRVRTTAPEQYCVQPNSGFLRPGEWKRLTITLQPLEGTPPEAGRHKFMIQSCVPPPESFVDREEIWEEVDPADITMDKLTVTFLSRGNLGNEESSDSAWRPRKRRASCSPRLQRSRNGNNTFMMNEHQESSASVGRALEVPPSYTASQDAAFLSLRESLKSNTDENEELKKKVDRLEKLIDVMLKQNLKQQQAPSNEDGPSSSTSQDATVQKSLESLADENEELRKRLDKLEKPSCDELEKNLKHQQTQANEDGPSSSTSQDATMQKSLGSLADENEELRKRLDKLELVTRADVEQNLKHQQTQTNEDGPSPDTSYTTSQAATMLKSLELYEELRKRVDNLEEAIGVELEENCNNLNQKETESSDQTFFGCIYSFLAGPETFRKYFIVISISMLIGLIAAWLHLLVTERHVGK
ncbi:hypothetical protein CAEBREN_05862 [Caenorhabditis brenneri]|uniref:Major sperm protein n=1 Tax=Caenorhabditis brenneri TaxID=135651 RepID=G0MEZ2_CAEBE|nr:hypothetical protein CAEBREN_05862 [Caenorhabditis brenneri]